MPPGGTVAHWYVICLRIWWSTFKSWLGSIYYSEYSVWGLVSWDSHLRSVQNKQTKTLRQSHRTNIGINSLTNRLHTFAVRPKFLQVVAGCSLLLLLVNYYTMLLQSIKLNSGDGSNPLNWLNLTIGTFNVKCKKMFLKIWRFNWLWQRPANWQFWYLFILIMLPVISYFELTLNVSDNLRLN